MAPPEIAFIKNEQTIVDAFLPAKDLEVAAGDVGLRVDMVASLHLVVVVKAVTSACLWVIAGPALWHQ